MTESKAYAIIMSAESVRAILADTKTMTRRLLKLPDWVMTDREEDVAVAVAQLSQHGGLALMEDGRPKRRFTLPWWVGRQLWVRETHYVWNAGNNDGSGKQIDYQASTPDAPCSWTSSMFMPRSASRITLEVVSTRIERVQEISEEDAIKEGVKAAPFTKSGRATNLLHVATFENTWNSLHGPGAWVSNPWVVVIEFKRIEG